MKKIFALILLLIFSCSSESNDDTTSCPSEPQLITLEVSNITLNEATNDSASITLSAQIINSELGPNCEIFSIVNQGFVYSTNVQPTIDDNVVNVNGEDISVVVSDLPVGTQFHIRSYLTNSLGTFYGNEVTVLTPTSTNPLFLDENGVTVKAKSWAEVGMTGVINGDTYTIIDRDILNEMLEQGEDVTKVCTTFITDLSGLYVYLPDDGEGELSYYNVSFNQDIGSWDVSNVTQMVSTFYSLASFDKDISDWDVSNVTNMSWMFVGALNFNQPLNDWDVSNVTNMSHMFSGPCMSEGASFNQPLDNWDVSGVTDMSNMFACSTFNQDISVWNVSNVEIMNSMFSSALNFAQPLNDWDVSNVTDMSVMFAFSNFNQPLDNWDVSNVTDMSAMFYYTTSFNQNISAWDVSSVISMAEMFSNSQAFNQNLYWNVSNVAYMNNMFSYSEVFNQDISHWDVSNVTNMGFMFYDSQAFNQDLSNWNVNNVLQSAAFCSEAEQYVLPTPNFVNADWNGTCNPDCAYSGAILDAGLYPDEISWDITSADGTVIYEGNNSSNVWGDNPIYFEMDFGETYTFNMYDSYGDGWNGAIFILFSESGEQYEFTFDSGYYGIETIECIQ